MKKIATAIRWQRIHLYDSGFVHTQKQRAKTINFFEVFLRSSIPPILVFIDILLEVSKYK